MGRTVDSKQSGGGVRGGHEDVNEFKGPERCVGDSFGFDKEDSHPNIITSRSRAAIEGVGCCLQCHQFVISFGHCSRARFL